MKKVLCFGLFWLCYFYVIIIVNIVVDAWNERIGELNPATEHELIAECCFSETDDIFGYLSSIMTEDTMDQFDRTGIPPHNLKLKVISVM